jgi:hypothetical protein
LILKVLLGHVISPWWANGGPGWREIAPTLRRLGCFQLYSRKYRNSPSAYFSRNINYLERIPTVHSGTIKEKNAPGGPLEASEFCRNKTIAGPVCALLGLKIQAGSRSRRGYTVVKNKAVATTPTRYHLRCR